MTQSGKAFQRGLLILFEAWGGKYDPPESLRPILPTEDIGVFHLPSIAETAAKLKHELDVFQFKQLVVQTLSLDTRQKIVEFSGVWGFPLKETAPFFYLEAVYALLPFNKEIVRDNTEVLELLAKSLFSFGISEEATSYLLMILDMPLDKLLPALEKLIENQNWIVRSSVVGFCYGLHNGKFKYQTQYALSKDQWRRIQTMLEKQLEKEGHFEVKQLIERELYYISMRTSA
jgi:hypothetical protein